MQNSLKTHDFPTLSHLHANKSVVFYSPLSDKETFVRTGATSKSNSFLHSVLFCLSNTYQRENSKKNRKKMVKNLINNLNGVISIEEWYNTKDSRKILYKNLIDILSGFFHYIETKQFPNTKFSNELIKTIIFDKTQLKIFSIFFDLLTFNDFKKLILKIFKTNKSKSIEKLKDSFSLTIYHFFKKKFNSIKYLESNKKQFLLQKLNNFLIKLIFESEKFCLQNYLDKMDKIGDNFSKKMLIKVSKHFSRDIYFINSVSRLPEDMFNEDLTNFQKSLILLTYKDNINVPTFEPVGTLLLRNRVKREFAADNELIFKIHSCLYNPEKLKRFPELYKFISGNDNEKDDDGFLYVNYSGENTFG